MRGGEEKEEKRRTKSLKPEGGRTGLTKATHLGLLFIFHGVQMPYCICSPLFLVHDERKYGTNEVSE